MINTLIVDDQNIIRKGIKVLLEDKSEIELIAEAEDGESALDKIAVIQPDVVLLDINLPGIDGITVANQIATQFPQIKVIMLSSYEDKNYVRQAMASNAKGYLLKNVSAEELEWSIKLVHQGYSVFKSELLTSLIDQNQEINSEPLSSVDKIKLLPVEKIEDKIEEKIEDHVIFPVLSMSSLDEQKSAELELLLARNHVRQKYSAMKWQGRNFKIHDVTISRAKKTMMSFEFRLLVFIMIFSLGFLVFVALS